MAHLEGTPTEYMRICWVAVNEGEALGVVSFWRTWKVRLLKPLIGVVS